MSAHTPGPWDVPNKSVKIRGCNFLAQVHWEDDDEAEANARLIAAAPDLLAALQRFVDQARVGSGNKAVTRSARVNCPAGIYHDARAAIAKAVQP